MVPPLIILLQVIGALLLLFAGGAALLRLSGRGALCLGFGLLINALALGINVPLFTLGTYFSRVFTFLVPGLLLFSLIGYALILLGILWLPAEKKD